MENAGLYPRDVARPLATAEAVPFQGNANDSIKTLLDIARRPITPIPRAILTFPDVTARPPKVSENGTENSRRNPGRNRSCRSALYPIARGTPLV